MEVNIVIPAYNEEDTIETLIERISEVCKELTYKIIVVDDGSTDQTLSILKSLRNKHSQLRYLSFSRNFGHQNALRAGIEHADGDCIITMDADLQHPPELIFDMLNKWQEGYEIVSTVRNDTGQKGFFKKFTSRLFYVLQNKLSDVKIEKGAADFRLIDAKIAHIVKESREHDLFMRGFFNWVGFRHAQIKYDPSKRFAGETKYTLKKMFGLALSGITSFSIRPLRLSIILGMMCAGFAFLYFIFVLIIYFFTDWAISGWASLIASILLIGGIQLLVLGIMGEYIGKMFIQSKQRPAYIIREKEL